MYILTKSRSVGLLSGQLKYMVNRGLRVALVTSPDERLRDISRAEGVAVFPVFMEREIRPIRDAVSLVQLIFLFYRQRPKVVNAGTPKAGLLGMIAATITRVPVRVYTQRGLRLETTVGLKRRVLSLTERFAMGCATRVICVSKSLERRILDLRLVDSTRSTVLACGSSRGVDADRFAPSQSRLRHAQKLRNELGIPPSAPVVGFVGRLVSDKGIDALFEAFEHVRRAVPETRLLLIGDFDVDGGLSGELTTRLHDRADVVLTGRISDVAPYYHVMDLLAFSSYREGFPNVVLEAAAAERPVVGFAATGTIDAIVDGVTGTIVPCADAAALADAIQMYLNDSHLRVQHGRAARERVLRDFVPQDVWQALFDEYARLLSRCK